MKIFLLVFPLAVEWNLALIDKIRAERPNSNIVAMPFSSCPSETINRIRSSRQGRSLTVYDLNSLETEWLNTSLDENLLRECEQKLGVNDIRNILTADRDMSPGFFEGQGRYLPQRIHRVMRDAENVRRYIVQCVDFWFRCLEKESPDLVFCMYGAVDAVSVACAKVAKFLKIPFLCIEQSRIGNGIIFNDSPDGVRGPVNRWFNRVLEDASLVDDWVPFAQNYVKTFRENPQPLLSDKFHYGGSGLKLGDGESLSGFVSRGSKWAIRVWRHFVSTDLRTPEWTMELAGMVTSRLNEWKALRSDYFSPEGSLPARPFIFFPLNVIPEASTLVYAPLQTNLLAAVEALVKAIPLGMNLVVKEHLPMLGTRPLSFYKHLKKIPTVILASPFEKSTRLIADSRLTCVISGTAGWESILLKKPTLVLGNAFFSALGQGFVYCSDLSSLSKAIDQAMEIDPVNDQRLALYVAAIMSKSFDFPPNLLDAHPDLHFAEKHPEILDAMFSQLLSTLAEL